MVQHQIWASPLLRWAGSKRKLLPVLTQLIPDDMERYFEPFAGSGCLFFAIRPTSAVLGDINSELIETYRILARHPRLVSRLAHRFRRDARSYYRIRRRISLRSNDPIEFAARFVYLNRNCFNGVFRINREGNFNVPRGTRTGDLPSEQEFYRCAVALRSATLRAMDYKSCVADVRPKDFIYLDPPYASRRRNTHGEYGYNCFSENDLPALVDQLRWFDKMGATFLFSYCEHRILSTLPRRWHQRTLTVRRHVAGFSQHRGNVQEVLVTNRRFSLEREDE